MANNSQDSATESAPPTTTIPQSPLPDINIDQETWDNWASQNLISITSFQRGRALLGGYASLADWHWFSNYGLLLMGAGSLVAGIFFFFAYNWASIPPAGKLGVLQFLLISSAAIAIWQGLDKISARVLLLVSAGMVGAFLAVFGQIYQTGADAYQLFLSWGFFIFGWTVIARDKLIWILFTTVTYTGIALYIFTFPAIDQLFDEISWVYWSLILLFWEGGRLLHWDWLQGGRWLQRLALFIWFFISTALMVDFVTTNFSSSGWQFLIYTIYLLTSITVYSQLIRDLFGITLLAFSLVVIQISWFFEIFSYDNAFVLLCTSLLVVGEVGAIIVGLRWLDQRWSLAEEKLQS
ncbi:MAG TPA: DUF2157 domain-containing protein [Anaerolineae bacterium]|nr:DUF2157 domain-containing protein [Anaerolineae bacterium]